MRSSKYLRTFTAASSPDEMIEAAGALIASRDRPYDWVIAADDPTLLALTRLEWPPHLKPRIFPVPAAGKSSHLYSKTGLSRILSESGIQTPPFAVVRTSAEAIEAGRELGFPVFLKVDASGSGSGVRLCSSARDLTHLEPMFDGRDLLVQKEIAGRECDLSPIYFESELVYFSYSVVERALPRFGPSVVRTFHPLARVSDAVREELTALGRAIGANGFVNVSCIEAADGSGRWYFEADLRPNVWVDIPRSFGDDPAVHIRNWFDAGTALSKESVGAACAGGPITVPYFTRLRLWELLINRYRVWRFIPHSDRKLVLRLLAARCIGGVGKMLVPSTAKAAVKQRLCAAGVLFD